MSDTKIPHALLAAVKDGNVALVLGAGASLGAEHPKGEKAPLGADLAKRLSGKFLGGKHADKPLSIVAEYAQNETDLRTVQEFIAQLFEPFRPGEHHRLLPSFKWHGIATVNYDLVLERAYDKSTTQRLRPVIANRERMEDIIKTPSDLLYLKLHGCITRTNDPEIPMILTPEQYITHKSGRSRLFERLAAWGAEKPIVFVGTTINDYDIRQIILELSRETETRPRYYLVEPFADEIVARNWEKRKITTIPMDFATLLSALDNDISGIARAVPVAPAPLAIYSKFNTAAPVLGEATRLALEHDFTFVTTSLLTTHVDPKLFYRGFSQGWAAIEQALDCPRDLTQRILLDVILDEDESRESELVIIKAPAGAGKTVALHRLAWEAAKELDAICLFANGRVSLTTDALEEIVEQLSGRLYVFVDDVADNVAQMERLLAHAEAKRLSVTFIGAERTNEWNVACDSLDPYVSSEFTLPYLSRKEIGQLLDLLTKHHALDRLAGRSREEQEHEFGDRAGRQLLVALHEATLGEPFEAILRNEYNAIVPESAQRLYLTVCTLNRTGTPVRAGLISRVHGVPFDRFKEAFFRPLEHVVTAELGWRRYDYEYRARHPHIADLVFQNVLSTPELRYEKIMSVLGALDVSYETDRKSFQDLINARTLRELIGSPPLIENIFKLAEERAKEDGHVWLQHGLFEMRREGGNLDRAATLLAKAHVKMPHNSIIAHSYAELEIIRADREPNALVREKHLKEARKLAIPLTGRNSRGGYGYHTLFKVEHMRLKAALRAPDSGTQSEDVSKAIKDAETVLTEGLQHHPGDATLISAEAELAQTLRDNERARAALTRAAEIDPRNGSIVGRLARVYIEDERFEEAKQLLQKGLEASPGDKRLNYGLALLLRTMGESGQSIEFHLRRAFTEGDRNLEAQFLYARQLYVNGKVSESRERFRRLKNERTDWRTRNKPKEAWLDNGNQKRFRGRVTRVTRHYGLVERDGDADPISVPVPPTGPHPIANRCVGDRVSFGIAFNFHGPVAIDIRDEY
ncbi:MAG: SIR2 family protein [Phycisphaeraceae bacterium]|nr:SIR2 family protein [Phycisphaeraceae bacterium]